MKLIQAVRLLFIFLGFILSPLARAGDIKVELTVDTNSLAVGDEVQAQVAVSGTSQSPEPQMESRGDFEIQKIGTSSQVQIVNGSTTVRTSFTYVVVPKKTGVLKLGPARVTIDGKGYQSETVTLQVTQANQRVAGSKGKSDQDANFRLEAQVDNKNPYVNQQILYTFRFLRKGQIQNANLNLPDFSTFLKEQLDKQRDYQTTVNGVPWLVTEIKYALFPTTLGSVTIDPTTLTVEAIVNSGQGGFDSFFENSFFNLGGQQKRLRLKTDPIVIHVQGLPTEGRPANFSNLVGKFFIKGGLTRNELAVGDSTTLSIEIEGQGNIRDAKAPELALNGFKVYDDQPSLKVETLQGKLGGIKTFKKALIPLEAGTKTIPGVTFNYFDTSERAYRTLKTADMPLTVVKGSGAEELTHVAAASNSDEKKEVKIQGQDIMAVRREIAVMRTDDLTPAQRNSILGLALACPLLYLFGFVWKRKHDLNLKDSGYYRREKAYKRFLTGAQKLDGPLDFEKMSFLLRTYLGDKLNFDGQALTPIDLERKLRPFQVSDAAIKEGTEFLKLCERGQYGGIPGGKTGAELKQTLLAMVANFEKEISL